MLPPEQMVVAVAEAEVGAVELVFTVIVTETQAVLLQVPSARTKYVVVVAGLTAMELPLPTDVPPQLPLYHCQLAPVPSEPPTTKRLVLLPGQTVVDVAVAATGAVEGLLTVMVTCAQVVLLQVPSARTK